MADPIDTWLLELRAVLASLRPLRSARITEEIAEHLRMSAEDFQRRGLPRREAEVAAVERIGDPASFAQGFSRPTGRHWLIETIAWTWSRAVTTLVALGAFMLLVEVLVWASGSGQVSAHAVRIWQTCKQQSSDGECVGGWRYTYASALDVLGGLCLLAGLAGVIAYRVFRRHHSDLELMPRLMDAAARVLLAVLGVVLLVGGTIRSSLDGSWHWVPVWLLAGLACPAAALLLHRADKHRHGDMEVVDAPGDDPVHGIGIPRGQ